MANKYNNLNDLFTAMANAIRLKNESTGTIIADNFPTEIANLKTRFDYNNQNVTVLPDHAFYGCEGLNNVDCYNLTTVGASAFEDCKNLKTVILYDGVENVGENAFKGCDDLTIYCMFDSKPDTWHENWNPDNCKVVWCCVETWDISDGEKDNVTAKLCNDVHNDGYYLLFINGNGDMRYYPVSGHAAWRNYKDNIKIVIIFDGVTSIGGNAFGNCTSLTSVIIPDSVTRINESAFQNCTSLTTINIPDNVTNIDAFAFDGCTSLTSITIPDSVTEIYRHAFYNTAYYNDDSNWDNDVLYIDNALIGARTTISGDYNIKEGTTVIAYGAFSSCYSLTSITIPNSITNICEDAFDNCTSLTSITIPDSVISISDQAFRSCKSLTSITIPDSVTSIGNYAFGGCESLISITIPDSVTSIGSLAFSYCESLTSIVIPDSVTSIDYGAFLECESLTSINIPDSITSIETQAFYYCESLTSIVYTGTIAQWNAITFGSKWNFSTGNYTIHCTDGDIAKDGTITYHTTT